MPKTKYLLLAGCLLLSFSHTGFSQSDKAKKIDELITPIAGANQFSGVVLASENGKVIYEKAFGHGKCGFQDSQPTEHAYWYCLNHEVHDECHPRG